MTGARAGPGRIEGCATVGEGDRVIHGEAHPVSHRIWSSSMASQSGLRLP